MANNRQFPLAKMQVVLDTWPAALVRVLIRRKRWALVFISTRKEDR